MSPIQSPNPPPTPAVQVKPPEGQMSLSYQGVVSCRTPVVFGTPAERYRRALTSCPSRNSMPCLLCHGRRDLQIEFVRAAVTQQSSSIHHCRRVARPWHPFSDSCCAPAPAARSSPFRPDPTARDLVGPVMADRIGFWNKTRPRCYWISKMRGRWEHPVSTHHRYHNAILTFFTLISQWLSMRRGCHTEPFRSLVDHPGQEIHQLGTGPERVVCKRSMPHACGLCTPQRCTHHNPQLPKRYGGI